MKSHFISLTIIISLLSATLNAQPNYPTDPNNAELITQDLEVFLKAYSLLNEESDTAAILQINYLDKGTPGLQEYIQKHQLTADLIKEAIGRDPESYNTLPAFLKFVQSMNEPYKETLSNYSKIVPNAVFPPTYILVGANRGIGQASKSGQLISVTRLVSKTEVLMPLIIHELTHFQQAMTLGFENYISLYQNPDMLGFCIREGSAEFITYLTLNEITQSKSLQYLNDNEADLWLKFNTDLETENSTDWLWETIGREDIPMLLGYVMGYKIADSYYQNADNKSLAVMDILAAFDYGVFLSASRYDGGE
jgi:hypothetical protein